MGKWVVTVAGISILSVLCDVILPEGQTRKYVKTVFGVVVSLVIIEPLIGLFSDAFHLAPIDGDAFSPQTQYLESVANRQNDYALNTVWKLLDIKGLNVKNIQLDADENILTLEFDTQYDLNKNTVVEEVVKAYFSTVKIVTIWSR